MSTLYVKQLNYRKPLNAPASYPFDLPFLEQLNDLVFDQPVTFIVGENGVGKS